MHPDLPRRHQAALLAIACLLFIAALESSELLIAASAISLVIAAGAIALQRGLFGKSAIDPGRTDLLAAGTPEAIYASGDTFIAAANARGKPTSILIFEQVDLPELHAIFGPAATAATVAKFNRTLTYLAGANGLAARLGPTTWAVLLPGHDTESVLNRVKGSLGQGLATEVEGSEEILLVPRIAVHTVTIEKAAPMRQICDELHEQVIRGWKLELRREDYLRRERESHSLRAKRLTRPPEPAAGIFAGGSSTRNSRVTSRSIVMAHSGRERRKTAERLAMSFTAERGEQPIESCS